MTESALSNVDEVEVEIAYQKLIDSAQKFNPDIDTSRIRKVFEFAREKHKLQFRSSGEPYICHPLAVATILTEFQMGETVIGAALLHDVIEDCKVTFEEISSKFGEETARLVDGVTKLKLPDFEASEYPSLPEDLPPPHQNKKHGEVSKSAANLRKILLAMARDLRVMIIKLADRLHNMRTLSALPPNRQLRVAKETLEIFAPLAHRLGIWQIKWQLEDLAFKYVNPVAYADVSEKVARTRREREEDIKLSIDILAHRLEHEGIEAEINGRPKHLYSIYNKMRTQHLDIKDIFDQIALRVIVNTLPECYHALGVVHDQWMPIAGLFDDYIAKPKSNGYQSLHTKVLGPAGQPLEIQIRTREMHMIADFGIAAHWQYKEGGTSDALFDRKMSFLRQPLFDWQSDSRDAGEFLRSVVSDLFTDQVFVFTPRGDVLDLPAGATPIDVAFRIHSDLGMRCVGARVNARIVPLSHKVANGDIVDIITRPNAAPSLDWLTIAKTSHARSKIKHYFRKARFSENVTRGREMLQKEAEKQHFDFHIVRSIDQFIKAREVHFSNYHTDDDLMAAIGYGETPAATVVQKMRSMMPEKPKEDGAQSVTRRENRGSKLEIGGDLRDVAIVRAKCCAPVPGDPVIGYMTRGKGIALHRAGCANVAHYQHTEASRLVEIEWKPIPTEENPPRYSVEIRMDLADRVGLLEDVGKLFAEARTNIQAIRTRSNVIDHTAAMQIQFDAWNASHIEDIMTRLRRLTDVLEIRRVGANETPVM
jgi:GTP pyrophosphokinase